MKYGNCFCGALFLMWMERKNKPKLIMKYRPGTSVPHFMIRTKDKLHHFNLVQNILWWPLCYVIFKGQFQTVNISESEDYNK